MLVYKCGISNGRKTYCTTQMSVLDLLLYQITDSCYCCNFFLWLFFLSHHGIQTGEFQEVAMVWLYLKCLYFCVLWGFLSFSWVITSVSSFLWLCLSTENGMKNGHLWLAYNKDNETDLDISYSNIQWKEAPLYFTRVKFKILRNAFQELIGYKEMFVQVQILHLINNLKWVLNFLP